MPYLLRSRRALQSGRSEFDVLEARTLLSIQVLGTPFTQPTTVGSVVVPWLQANASASPTPTPSGEFLVGAAQWTVQSLHTGHSRNARLRSACARLHIRSPSLERRAPRRTNSAGDCGS